MRDCGGWQVDEVGNNWTQLAAPKYAVRAAACPNDPMSFAWVHYASCAAPGLPGQTRLHADTFDWHASHARCERAASSTFLDHTWRVCTMDLPSTSRVASPTTCAPLTCYPNISYDGRCGAPHSPRLASGRAEAARTVHYRAAQSSRPPEAAGKEVQRSASEHESMARVASQKQQALVTSTIHVRASDDHSTSAVRPKLAAQHQQPRPAQLLPRQKQHSQPYAAEHALTTMEPASSADKTPAQPGLTNEVAYYY